MGAQEGEVLGSVPREIVRHAACDVLVVQTSALNDEMLVSEPRRT
jgi:maltose/moltooligosaccharide transporter